MRMLVGESERALGDRLYDSAWYRVLLPTADASGMFKFQERPLEVLGSSDNHVPTSTWNLPKDYDGKVRMKFEVTSEQMKGVLDH